MHKLVLLVMLILTMGGCSLFAPDCGDEINSEEASPDARYTATIFQRDCGATTDFSTIVSLRASSAKFNADKERIFVVKGKRQIKVVWESPTSLRLECLDCNTDEIFKQEKAWEEVHISY